VRRPLIDPDVASPARPIRIGHVIGQLTRGGAERQLYELVRGIDRDRFQCIVYCLSEDTAPFGEMITAAGVTVEALPRARGLDVGRVLTLARLARRDRLDILHSFLVHASGYAWPAQRLAGVPRLITSARNCQVAGGVRDRLIRHALRHSDAIVCNGEAVREFVAQRYGIPAERCRVIYNGVDLARFAARARPQPRGDGPRAPTIITVGRLVPQKDLPLFLEAAALLGRDCPAARFLVVGGGPSRPQLERSTAALGLGGVVSFLGERDDVADLLQAADVFWLTSAWEGLPNVLLEAQSSALPVVTCDVGAAREIVRHGLTGYVVPRRDAGEFASLTHRLLAEPERAHAMGLAGRKAMEEMFSLAAMVRSTEQLYEEVRNRSG
jgi:L-malate glycosyltransferase